MACTTSIGPGATNLVTAAALAHVNRLPVLLLPGDIFVSRAPDPVLQQVESFADGTLSDNDCLRPVSRYFDRIVHPQQLLTALPRALAVLTDAAQCGPVTLALPQDVQAMAFDYPAAFFEPRMHTRRAASPTAEDIAAAARVLRDACRQVMQWHNSGMILRLSVNLSVQQLQHDSWLSIVEEALASSQLPPSYLDLEITESVIITHPEKAVATLVKLKQMGVSITVDDFGTGYSSLSYLARLPIQAVKIDQRFVRGLEQNRNDEAITVAIIALSHSLNLRVIAEGVETTAQYEFLKRHGCEEAQGFLISRPLEEPELRQWWDARERGIDHAQQQPDLWREPGFNHSL